MPKAPKAPETEDRSELLTTKIIPEIIGGCSYDMDNGAIFGRVHARLREFGASAAEIGSVSEEIQTQVDAHCQKREEARQRREARMNAEAAALLKSDH